MIVTSAQTAGPGRRVSQRGEPAWELAYFFPTQGDWSEEDYLALSRQHRVELVDGCIEVLPMGTIFHQLLADFLHTLLKAYLATSASPEHRRGRALFAPLPVRFGKGRFRDPDVDWGKFNVNWRGTCRLTSALSYVVAVSTRFSSASFHSGP